MLAVLIRVLVLELFFKIVGSGPAQMLMMFRWASSCYYW